MVFIQDSVQINCFTKGLIQWYQEGEWLLGLASYLCDSCNKKNLNHIFPSTSPTSAKAGPDPMKKIVGCPNGLTQIMKDNFELIKKVLP